MRELLAELNRAIEQRRACVWCAVVETRGSTPQKAGAAMLVFADGSQRGTLGGGQSTSHRRSSSFVARDRLRALVRGEPVPARRRAADARGAAWGAAPRRRPPVSRRRRRVGFGRGQERNQLARRHRPGARVSQPIRGCRPRVPSRRAASGRCRVHRRGRSCRRSARRTRDDPRCGHRPPRRHGEHQEACGSAGAA